MIKELQEKFRTPPCSSSPMTWASWRRSAIRWPSSTPARPSSTATNSRSFARTTHAPLHTRASSAPFPKLNEDVDRLVPHPGPDAGPHQPARRDAASAPAAVRDGALSDRKGRAHGAGEWPLRQMLPCGAGRWERRRSPWIRPESRSCCGSST